MHRGSPCLGESRLHSACTTQPRGKLVADLLLGELLEDDQGQDDGASGFHAVRVDHQEREDQAREADQRARPHSAETRKCAARFRELR